MSSTENKALVRRFLEEVANQGNLAVIDELYAPSYRNHRHLPPGVAADRAGWKQLMAIYRAGFPDLHFTIEDEIAEGDKVVIRWAVTGTQRGAFMGMAPTGKPIAVGGIWISRISDGQISEEWGVSDQLGMLQQLGVVPASGG
ncbi:MAG TPA: ester cyclase [Caldilineaceae bacterium]|nr:ester cyclase [Caldilineaceae bacterium]